jgi:hypothetical protein
MERNGNKVVAPECLMLESGLKMNLNWMAPIAPNAQPMRYVVPENFVLVQHDDPYPDWDSLSKSKTVEIIEREPERRLRNTVTAPPFVGCGRKRNPVFILKANVLSTLGSWTKKCGSERGTDSGQCFICADCAIEKGYRW